MDRINISDVLDTGSIPVSGAILKRLSSYKFDFERIKQDTLDIVAKYNLPQIGLTHSLRTVNSPQIDKILECTGSIYNYDDRKFTVDEKDFRIFNEEFKSTSLYEMFTTIRSIGRFRIMTMDGPGCYTFHRDQSMRYHYVIDTNPDCLFLFPDQASYFHIPCDQNLYIVDTRKKHSFINGSRTRRIHLVLNDLITLPK
jgi:hypothetical protein